MAVSSAVAGFRDLGIAPVPEVIFTHLVYNTAPMKDSEQAQDNGCAIRRGEVVSNVSLCREHYRLTIVVSGEGLGERSELGSGFPVPVAGQFVHLSPQRRASSCDRMYESAPAIDSGGAMLRRAFSIAGYRATAKGAEVDVIYRVVGVGTRWMGSLRAGDSVSVLGPQGNAFPIVEDAKSALLVAGGVGLPPMLFLEKALRDAGKQTVAICGAQTADLLALTIDEHVPPSSTATEATASAVEFTERGANVVISTDDGSLGLPGHVGNALTAYCDANPVEPEDVVVYTCGPERMMEFVAEFCDARGIRCYVCMERAMACGTGMCQSCVVPVRDEADAQGWRYQLCCMDGPVFDANDVLFTQPT
jgi:dihydroorotate dehydrogenase electron transfer subunit